MTQKKNLDSSSLKYYISPTNKIHSVKCRHCKPDADGWQEAESFLVALDNGGQPCRLCCPSAEEIALLRQSSSHLSGEDKTSIAPEKQKKKLSVQENKDKSSSVEPKEKTHQPEKKRYKILAGNGCHQAIAEVQGILVPPSDENNNHTLILPDGCTLDATFKDGHLKWLAYNREIMLGGHWFRGYPKMKDDKLVAFQIVAWDKGMPTSERGWETWEFTGVWTLQKNLTVQRSMGVEDVRQQAKETGFIKKFKYTFNNTYDWLNRKRLWSGYVYKLLCRREGNTLKIQKVIPYACPRLKPVPPDKRFKSHDKSSKNSPE